ncbi:MAG: DNA polymerase III subunit chi [Pseudomonadota bacterium]
MAEVRFYHLTDQSLEAVLPVMLERSVERGWKAVVRGTEPARISALDTHLWTYRQESFLPHSASEYGMDDAIWLTCKTGVNSGANTLFLIDGANLDDAEAGEMEMTAILFDGLDSGAVEHARGQWRQVTASGIRAVYWAQERGTWVKKSESR